MRFWLCALGIFGIAWLGAQTDDTGSAPIRRVVIYKDGHCLTEREVLVDADRNPVRIENSFNALMGGVWAATRHKTARIDSLYARFLEEKRQVPPANLAELLLLNEGKRVAVTITLPAAPAPNQPVEVEQYEGVLRVFKPSLAYEDAYPTAEPPPDYTPQPTPRPPTRWDWYYYQTTPPDYVHDRFSRTAQQATFAVETASGLAMFTPAQVQQIEFREPYVREREATVKRPVLELTLSGAGRGDRVPVRLYSIEKGVRWMPEYQLRLPTARASEATLTLSGVILNELQDLKEVEAAVAVGSIQFMMDEQPSPLGLREAFRKLSRWFGDAPSPVYYYAASPSVADLVGFGGVGGVGGQAVPNAPGMGIEQGGAPTVNSDSIAFLSLPRLTLPKGGVARVEIAQQQLSVDHAYLWIHDLTDSERGNYFSWPERQDRQRFTTFEDLAYRLAQERRFRNEVYEALILRNTGDTPWTTAPITIMRGESPVGQDILLFTPPGEEAFVFITPAPRISLACTVEQEREQNRGFGTQWTTLHRATIRVQNLTEQPVRIMARVRFVGHYKDATREPKRIVAKTVEDTRFWDWYYRNRLQMNPYTELVWDVEVPVGVSEWNFQYERRGAP